jgi:hypothetical protein
VLMKWKFNNTYVHLSVFDTMILVQVDEQDKVNVRQFNIATSANRQSKLPRDLRCGFKRPLVR